MLISLLKEKKWHSTCSCLSTQSYDDDDGEDHITFIMIIPNVIDTYLETPPPIPPPVKLPELTD